MKDLEKLSKLLRPCLETDEFLRQLQSEGITDRILLRYICRKYFLAFCLAVDPKYQATRFHSLLANKLQGVIERVERNEDVRLLVEVPPRHGKSALISTLLPAWTLGRDAWPVICASYGSTLAEEFSQKCRDIVGSKTYRIIFPSARPNPDSTSKELWKTLNGGQYRATGVSGTLTGLGGKLLLCDDPFKDRLDADSVTIRENVWRWWQSTFYTRREGKTGVVLLNTRWHMDDLTGRLLEQQSILEDNDIRNKMTPWERFTFPAIAEVDEYIDGELFRKQGEVLWPEKFSIDDLEKTRSVTDVYEWSSLYQQSPILSENATFRKEWFKYYDPTDIKTKILRYYTLVDLAISQKKTADNTVVRTVGKDLATGYLYLMDETAGRLDPLQTIDAIFRHVKMYRSTVYIESVGYQASLPQFILEEQRKTQTYFNVEELKHSSRATKDSRISGLIPRYKSGVIFHRREDVDLEMELLQYPKGRHEDRVDCLSFVLEIMDETVFPESPEQKEHRIKEERETFDPHRAFNRI